MSETPPPLLTPRFECFPDAMTSLDQWVTWEPVWQPEKRKYNKIPHNAATGELASSTDPTTWSSFAEARRAYEAGNGLYAGVGFCLHPDDPFAGIDLDHAIQEDRTLTEEAAAFVSLLNSYTEASPSGTGLRIFVRAVLPPCGRKRGNVEMYEAGRFLTGTGRRWPGTPARIEARQAETEEMHRRVWPAREKRESRPRTDTGEAPADDAELLRLAFGAKNGPKVQALYRGDLSYHNNDRSAADLGLCSCLAFWTGPHPDRLDRLFRASELMRDKWTEPHFAGGETYGERTIARAIESCDEFYSPPGVTSEKLEAQIERAIADAQRVAEETKSAGARAFSTEEDEPADETTTDTPYLRCTDVGNGQRLAGRHGDDILFCAEWGRWVVWDGRVWQSDPASLMVMRRAKDTAKAIYQEAADEPDEARRKELATHARRSEAHARLEAMIALARSEQGIPAKVDQFDRNRWLLNGPSGTIDLRSGLLRPHERTDLMTKITAAPYLPEATAPQWETFLAKVLPDAELRAFVQRAVGYGLTGDVSEQCLFFLYGSGSNGKSTFLGALMDALGDYAMQAAPDLLIAKEGAAGGPNNDVAELQGRRFVATVEVEDGKRMAEGLVKQITGGDRIKARFMRENFFEFDPTHKIFLAANHQPTIRGQDYAIWRRIKVVPFVVQIPEEEKDPTLPEKLRDELPGILAWAVRGCLEWRRVGLKEPPAVKEATEEYREGMDVLRDFLDDRCTVKPSAVATAADLFKAYGEWCEENSERPLGKKAFGQRLRERGIKPAIGVGPRKARGWAGVGIAAQSDVSDKTDPISPMNSQSKQSREDNRDFTSQTSPMSPEDEEPEWEEGVL